MRRFVVTMLAACSSPASMTHEPDAYVPQNSAHLGMNDVTLLLPLPTTTATVMKMTDGGELVPRALFTRLVVTPGDVVDPYEAFHLVAIRFDLCDRPTPGACATGDDGRLRLVFQPMLNTSPLQANDVALHAFYPIPNAELGGVVDELRALAELGATPTTAALAISPPVMAANAAYVAKLRTLVLRYASQSALVRLTLFAQNAQAAALNWGLRGVEISGGTFVDIAIPGIAAAQQRAILVGSDPGYQVTPVVDQPQGFAMALDSQMFGAASPAARATALGALVDAQNPLRNTAQTVQCIACHVSTYLLEHRAAVAAVDPATLPGRFASPYDLSIAAGMSATNERSLRNLGWLFDKPAISQRVANDTAEVLAEIDQRYPVP